MTCPDLSATVTDLLPTVGPSENRPIQESFIFQRTANVNCGLTGQSSVAAFLSSFLFFFFLSGRDKPSDPAVKFVMTPQHNNSLKRRCHILHYS